MKKQTIIKAIAMAVTVLVVVALGLVLRSNSLTPCGDCEGYGVVSSFNEEAKVFETVACESCGGKGEYASSKATFLTSCSFLLSLSLFILFSSASFNSFNRCFSSLIKVL